jgi:hypothetical protein
VYSNTPSAVLKSPFSLCSDTLVVASVNDDDIRRAIKRFRSTKSVGLDDIPNFVVKGFSEIFAPLLKFIIDLSLSMQTFPMAWKKQPLSWFLKKAIRPPLVTTGLLPF